MIEKYKFRRYDSNFPNLFIREKAKLKKILKDAKIEHIGSSSVKGLGGKGVLDISIVVSKKDLIKTKIFLEEINISSKSGGTEERLFFYRDYKYSGKIRRVHLQLTFKDSQVWKDHILVRDFLRTNKSSREEYAKIKKEAVKFAKGDGERYRQYKHRFLQNLIKKAKKELK